MTEGPKCALCKRSLKRPSPTGYGPRCWEKLHARPTPRLRRPTPTVTVPGPGQDELPYDELPLWNP